MRLGAGLSQRHQETLPIQLVVEDRLPPVPAIQDVVGRAGLFDAQHARHGPIQSLSHISVKSKERPLRQKSAVVRPGAGEWCQKLGFTREPFARVAGRGDPTPLWLANLLAAAPG